MSIRPNISYPGFDGPVVDGIDNLDNITNNMYESGNSTNLPSSDSTVADLIRASEIYKDAHELFSGDLSYGRPYLLQLEMIPDSYNIRDENFWDNVTEFFGGTSDYENLIKDSFNAAMDEIRQLVESYYLFKNSLPSEQVRQLAEAGINAAVTGQGITGSEKTPTTGVDTPLNQSYNNQALSQGVTSFVEFMQLMNNVVTGGFSSYNIMSVLDLAEREGYNKQEVHDLLLAGQGVTTPSPYRVLTPGNTPVVKQSSAISGARVAADAAALSATIEVSDRKSPEEFTKTRMITGQDVLNEISRTKLAIDLSESYINRLINDQNQAFASSVTALDNAYKISSYSAGVAEGTFKEQLYNARDPFSEGVSQSSILENLAFVRSCESQIRQFDAWISQYKMNTLNYWSEQLNENPHLAPYLYKGIFDFNMADTFYHGSVLGQGLKYGLDNAGKVSQIIGNIMGLRAPKPRTTNSHTVTSGPRGTTETISTTVIE